MMRGFGAKFVHPKLISEKQMKNLSEGFNVFQADTVMQVAAANNWDV
jgi:hypothetical protein